MQKNVLKHQFENFSTALNESLDKAYDRFQKLISQLEVHGAPISKEDINQKFLRSLPPSWNKITLIMRNKPNIDEIDIDDLYNNLRVYEDEMKRSSSSTSTSQNFAFLSVENTSSTNEVSTASRDFRVSIAGEISQVSSTPCAHDVACSFFAQPTTSPQLKNEDFQQIDEDDLEELDLRWQVAMLTVRVRKFIQKTGRNMDFKENNMFHLINQKLSATTVTEKGTLLEIADLEGIKGKYLTVTMAGAMHQQMNLHHRHWWLKMVLEAMTGVMILKSRLEIQGYELALESLESRIFVHEKNELAWGEKYEFQNYELKCREIKINILNLELEKVVKERYELKLKIEKLEESSKNLDELLNSQMSAIDKTGLGYDTQLNEMSNNYEFDRDFLTPRANISFACLDEYAIRKKIIESKTVDLNTKTSETIDDEDDVSEVQTNSPVKTNETLTVKTRVDKIGQTSQKQGIGFKKIKACFVCKSTDHLIKDCNFHDKQSQEPKVKTVVNTGPRVDKPVWDNTKRVNH
ncbi:hypothetical protein Tco_0641676 [Tanacetum coccineum]